MGSAEGSHPGLYLVTFLQSSHGFLSVCKSLLMNPNYLLKTLFPNSVMLGMRTSAYEFCENVSLVHCRFLLEPLSSFCCTCGSYHSLQGLVSCLFHTCLDVSVLSAPFIAVYEMNTLSLSTASLSLFLLLIEEILLSESSSLHFCYGKIN